MKIIDQRLKEELKQLVNEAGSVLALSKLLGVSHSTVLFWLNGKVKQISTDVWENKLLPILSNGNSDMDGNIENGKYVQKSFHFTTHTAKHLIPQIFEEDLLDYNFPFEKITHFIQRKSHTLVEFNAPIGPQYFSVQMNSSKMYRGFFREIRVFFKENIFLKNGDCAILRLREDNNIRLCRYCEQSGKCSFIEITTNETLVNWNKEEGLSRLLWMFTIVSVNIYCRPNENTAD